MDRAKKNILLLGLTSFFNDISSEAIYGLLPFYIPDTAFLGLIGGLFNGLGSIFKFVFGYASDVFKKRKPLVLAGYLTSAASKLAMALSKGPLLVIAILGDRTGKGIRTSPRDAILAEAKMKGYAFGLHRAMDTLGAITGSLLMYALLRLKWDVRTAMIIAAAIGFLSLIPLLFVDEPSVRLKKKQHFLKLSPEMKKFLVATFFIGLASISPMLLIKQASLIIGIQSLLVYALYNIFYVLSSRKMGSLSDLVGRRKVLIFSAALIAVSLLAATFGGKLLLLSFLLYGIGMGAFSSTAPAEMSDLEKSARGTALGFYHMTYGLGVFVGSILTGLLIPARGNAAMLFPALSGFLSVPLFARLK